MEVTIRPLKVEDAYTSVKWRNDTDVTRYFGNQYTNVITLDKELAWIKNVIANKDEYRCAIEADGKYIGNIYLTGIDGKSATYHIFIGDKEYWGKGIAYEASKLILKYAAGTLHLDSVNLKVRHMNRRACSLYGRLGFIEKMRDNDFIYYTIDLKDKRFV